ncbi:MAG: hypothetical protein A3A81_03105 [Omnitrophica bacterium RIFCSPLOWO2_01_FULL_45_10b]|nr:MAG: hypothetical protein A3A81_03105 [Omnitrophica bacterium RIFCSPLOWO2_01_FULL_45_10b]
MLLINFFMATKIVLAGFLIYRLERFLKTHRTWELCGLLFIFAGFNFSDLNGSLSLNLHRWLDFLLTLFIALMALEPEFIDLGRGLLQLGKPNNLNRKRSALGEIARAASALAATKTGALIAFERGDSLLQFGDTGIAINADIKKELLMTLFTKDTPTHDGGVLIRKGRVTHCGAVFPLSQQRQIGNGLGTRHRAALGLTEKTDAVCLIVSEEEGTISLAKKGELIYSVPPNQVEKKLRQLLAGGTRTHYYPLHYFRRFSTRLVQSNVLQFLKSPGEKIYELSVVLFWLSIVCLWNSYGAFKFSTIQTLIQDFYRVPWIYAPLILFGLNLSALFFSRTLVIDGLVNQVRQRNRFLFVPLFGRKISAEHLKAVILRREQPERELWFLGFLGKKQKIFFVDRASSAKALSEAAKKIRDVLKLELIG